MTTYTEKEIIKETLHIIEEHGEMTITELKLLLHDAMQPSGEDLAPLKNRKDLKFDQKVRNMISHRDYNQLSTYFSYDKDSGLIRLKQNISKRVESHKRFIARKVDFTQVNQKNKRLGDLGEQFIFDLEKEKLKDTIYEPYHVSLEEGDGKGYDILSYTLEGKARFLEVKTTKGPLETPFFISENERLFMECYKDAELVRVYNFDEESLRGQVKILNQDQVLQLNLKSVQYKTKCED